MTIQYDFSRLTDRDALVASLGIDDSAFERVIAFVPPPPADQRPATQQPVMIVVDEMPEFFRHDIPKRNPARGHRVVWQPYYTMPVYKALARRLDIFFGAFLLGYPHDRAFGYRPKRNIRENAAVHCGHRHLLSLDVKDFFPSISLQRVQGLFEGLNVRPEVAHALGRFTTIGGTLPLGVPTSPTISNAVALPIDEALHALALEAGASYSRYSDDISFSGDSRLPDIDRARVILAEHGFELAEAKTSRSKLGQSHYVTGLSVSDPVQAHPPRNKKRRLRQELYYARKFGLDGHLGHKGINDLTLVQAEVNRLDGLVKFVAHHEPRIAPRLKEHWRRALLDSGLKPSFAPKNQQQPPHVFLVDEAEFRHDKQRFLALCMVTTQRPDVLSDATKEVLLKLINDMWADGNTRSLVESGLHFAENTEDQRLVYVKRLATLPIQSYVAYLELTSEDEYESTYLRLLSSMLPRRLMAAESRFATLLFENNPRVSQNAIIDRVNGAHKELESANNRRPVSVFTNFVDKKNLGISAPDYFLGLLGRYLRSQPASESKPEPRDRLMFERLRDKYRVIADLSGGIEYTRRNPIRPWK